MWWLDPGKEVLNILFNRILAPYVENLDMNQVNYGIGQGQLTLRSLRLKKGALDKFRLPVDVVEGHLGKFTLSLHWMNLGNQPVEVLIEDVYLLVVPSSEGTYDPKEEEERKQAAKAERLENAELLHLQDKSAAPQEDQQQSQGLIASLITKIVNNLQVTVKRIHIRYEDRLSVPGHPFAAGITLSGFTAVSVNDLWRPAFIDSTAGTIHKLAKLESLAVYFDTDAPSLAGLSHAEFVRRFTDLIPTSSHPSDHQFVLQPVTGEGRIKMNRNLNKDTPQFDVQLLFDQIGVLLDDNQYRDAISLIDMYHFYIRQHQYQIYRPAPEEIEENRPRALLVFAITAILDEVRERRRKWTWAYFAERREDRHKYVELFKKKQLNTLTPLELPTLEDLERKLSYEDIRFYRSIARSQLRKDLAARKKLEEERQKQQAQTRGGWTSWLWGSSPSSEPAPAEESTFTGEMTDEQRKQLYEVLDYDEKTALAEAFQAPRDALKVRVVATLDKGSFALKTDPHGKNAEILSVVCDSVQSTFVQRPDNFEVSLSVGGLAVKDGTTTNTLYPLIVHVQEAQSASPTYHTQDGEPLVGPVDPFFFLKFENNPLDERADSALTVRMRYMEIVYHRGYVEAVYKFFKPPSSQLESVEALLNVASQTLEGLRKETRAGLEYALQTHKTIDVQMDLNAPIIIVPEDITTNDCRHLIIDAGHIAIESELADKKAIQEINAKRKQQYTDEDYKQLESMMYDRLTVRLQSAQFLIGNDLQSCREALTSDKHDTLHLLERINIDLQVQNSIVPTAYNLARFKVFGHLPTLHVNLSDTKYKSLMRLIDVAIPKFDEDSDDEAPRPTVIPPLQMPGPFILPPVIFGGGQEYNVEDGDDDDGKTSPSAKHGSITPSSSRGQIPDLHQHIFELDFQVDSLRASLSKSTIDGNETELGIITLDQFALDFMLEKFVMQVDINLKSVLLEVIQPGKPPLEFMSSASTNSEERLLSVKYTRAQPKSPEFLSVHEGVDQSVDVNLTTFVFRAAPEPLVNLYGFIMTTFVPEQKEANTPPQSADVQDVGDAVEVAHNVPAETIRVFVRLASVQVILINEDVRLATLAMSTGNVAILLRANTMQIKARLGSMSITDDSQVQTSRAEFKQLLSIEGDNFADLDYQTFDPVDKENYKGVRSAVHLTTASLKLHYLEQPLHGIYLFLLKLAELKGLYDAATVAAVQRASEIERMQFNVSIKSPIVILPSDPQHSADALTVRLGELTARNAYEGAVNKTTASLRGIQLASRTKAGDDVSTLKIIQDIDIDAHVMQTSFIDRSMNFEQPDTQITIKISDVITYLTQTQYCQLIELSQSIARVFSTNGNGLPSEPSGDVLVDTSVPSSVSLQPEIRDLLTGDGNHVWSTIDLVVTVDAVKLHLYDDEATTQANLKDHGIANFALKSNSLRTKMLSDGSLEAQVVLKSFTMNNTRPGNSKFREIVPAAQHDRNQVMVLYTMTGGAEKASMAVVTVDAPQVIFAVEPVIALLEFFTSPFPPSAPPASTEADATQQVQADPVAPTSTSVNFRLDLHDVSVSVLEDESNTESQAIRLVIKQILISQQGVLALSVDHLGMSLARMGHPTESVRFLDDVDLTFSMDTRSTSSQQMTSMEVVAKPVVLRASYRDINLIMTIVNKAIELYGKTIQSAAPPPEPQTVTVSKVSRARRRGTSRASTQMIGNAKVVTTKEQLKASIEGFRLVLIGDLHEQPMLHLKVKPFILGAKDWSGELQATTTLAVHISYWNLTNSHWEPRRCLLDATSHMSTHVSRDGSTGGLTLKLSAQERINLNLSTTFIELAIATMKVLGQDGERVLRGSRGGSAPYRIRNRTGCAIYVWSDHDGHSIDKDGQLVQIAHDSSVDWRFDDWKVMREHVSSAGHNSIGLQFIGKPWEQLRSIPVDREGEYSFSLRPRTEKFAHRVLCEVTVQDNVKIVTIRSTYRVENQTLYPLEITLVNEVGQPTHSLEKIVPGQDYALPIDAVSTSRIRIQPDQGFGYKWSPAIRWEDLLAKRGFTIRCPHTESTEAPFRFQAWVDTDAAEIASTKFPKLTLKLRAPIELENLLPYNLEYRIYDKDTDQNWRSYLRKGGIMPIHSVELRHLVLLNVTVQDTVYKSSDFSIINTDGNSDFETETRLTLRDSKDRKLDLRLNYVRYPDSGGCFKVQVYAPYVVINKTGLPFSVKPSRSARFNVIADVAGESRPDILSQPIPFLLAHPIDQGKNFIFKVGQSTWSQAVSLEAPAADTRLVIPADSQRAEEIHVGLSWAEGLGKYKLTKVITLSPRFLIRNAFSDPIQIREHGVGPKGRVTLSPGERAPLHSLRLGDEKLLTIATPGLNAHWSAPINLEDIGSSYFRLQLSESRTDIRLMRADVKLGGSTIFVVISQAEEGWPFIMENDSNQDFTFYQTDMDHPDNSQSRTSGPKYALRKKQRGYYAWDIPSAREKRIMLCTEHSRRAIDIMEIGDLVPFKVSSRQGSRIFSLDVRAEDRKQILRITDYNPEFSLYKPMQRSHGTLSRQDTLNSSHDAFEAVQEEVPPTLSFVVDFAGAGVSLINRRMIEVIYLSANGLKFEYTDSPVAQAVNLSCGNLQIDNQLHDALYPVVLQPTPIPKEATEVASLPTVQGSVIWLKDQEHGVLFVKYCSILLQALTVEADEDFLFSLIDLTKVKGASWDEAQEDVLTAQPEKIVEPETTAGGTNLYFEVLELQPIKLTISFMRTERVSGEEKLSIRNPFAVVVNAITMAVGNVNDAPLEMNALAIKDMRLTLPDLQDRILIHYRQEVLRQLYRILGSADFIGNPVGLFTNVSSGVADIFYEPINGAIMHGNKELGIGIAKGAASFVKKTVFGFSDSFTRITSSVGKGLSAATFDSEYQMKRRMAQRRNKPRHAIYGVAAGAEAFATSVASGIEGVLMKPIEGAESEGAKGFFKGMGKGLIGAVTKPVVGVFDLASNLSEGIRNTTTVFDNPDRARVRKPRHIPPDGVLVPFSEREALGQYWMKDLENGIYRKELYVAHYNIPGGDNVVLLTTSKVLSFWSNRLRLEWELSFSSVQGVTIEDTGIRFAHKSGREYDRFVMIPDKSAQTWFFGQIATVVKAYNARRRMD